MLAEPTDAGAVFDQVVESALNQENTPISCRGAKKVEVRKIPTRMAQRQVERSIAEVQANLRTVFRGLLTGDLPWPMYLWGPAGTGKTSAALAVLDYAGRAPNTRIDHEGIAHPVKFDDGIHDWLYGYVEVRSLAGFKIASDNGLGADTFCYPTGLSTWTKLLQNWRERIPLAIIDEIGVGASASDFRLDVLLEVLNTRCNHPVLPMIVTSNMSPESIEEAYDDRVASRILAGTVFHLGGKDRRIRT